MIRDVSFLSDGGRVMAHMLEPDAGQQNGAALVLCPDYGMTKEMILRGRLADLARAGFVVLALDYRFTGSSAGEPHAQVLPCEQVDDVRRAVTFLHREAAMQHVGLLGVGLGGGVALQAAAFDDRVGAVVAVSPVTDGLDWIRVAHGGVAWREMSARLKKDHDGRALAGYCEYVSTVGSSGNALLPVSDKMLEWFAEWQSTFPTVRRQITLRSLQAISEFHPQTFADLLAGRATCLIASTADTVVPIGQAVSFWHRCTEPRRFVLVPSELYAEHCDLLDGEAGTFVLAEAVGWMTTHLVTRHGYPSLRGVIAKARSDELQQDAALHSSAEVAAAQAGEVLQFPSTRSVVERDTEIAPLVSVEEQSAEIHGQTAEDNAYRTDQGLASDDSGDPEESPGTTMERDVATGENATAQGSIELKAEQGSAPMMSDKTPRDAPSKFPSMDTVQQNDPALFKGTGADPTASAPEASPEPLLALTLDAEDKRIELTQDAVATEEEVSWTEGVAAAIQDPTPLPTGSDEAMVTAQTQTAATGGWQKETMGAPDNGTV